MKILAVDTSSETASVAIMDNEKLMGEYSINHKKTHSQKLMPMIINIMENLDLKPEDIDVYAASSGPGSFTGLRIGVATIKAMAYSFKKPVVSVPTLDAFVYNVPTADALICPMMDARNRQVYTAVYRFDGIFPSRITDYLAVPVEDLITVLNDMNEKVVFLGDGAFIHKDILSEKLAGKALFVHSCAALQRASSVARLALEKVKRGEVEDSFKLTPFYLRKSQAEQQLEKQKQKI